MMIACLSAFYKTCGQKAPFHSKDQLADMFTKPLLKETFQRLKVL